MGILIVSTSNASATDSPGFRYGTDTSCPTVTGSAPYGNTFTNSGTSCAGTGTVSINGGTGYMGGYFGLYGGFQVLESCSDSSSSIGYDHNEAVDAETNQSDGYGFGTAMTYMGGGPGADPAYSSTYTAAQATAWGAKQGQDAYQDAKAHGVTSHYIFLDMESATHGWNEQLVGGPCSGTTNTGSCCTPAIARDVVDGFLTQVNNDGYIGGVYASYDFWNSETFSCGSCGSGSGYLPTANEFTYGGTPTQNNAGANPGNAPNNGWCEGGSSCTNQAQFFGGQNKATSTHTDAWQWCTQGGSYELGDYDQIKEANMGSS